MSIADRTCMHYPPARVTVSPAFTSLPLARLSGKKLAKAEIRFLPFAGAKNDLEFTKIISVELGSWIEN